MYTVFCALLLATQTLATQCYSLIHLQLLRTSDVKLAALANEEISKIIKQAVPEIHEEGDEIRFGSFNRQSFVCLT